MRLFNTYIISWAVLLSLIFPTLVCSQDYYINYNDDCVSIYNDIIQLKLTKAKLAIHELEINDPQNLARLHLENYIDFFSLFINENKHDFQLLEKNKDIRIKQIKSLIPDDDPYKKFVLAEINLQWALIRSKFDQLFKAGREIYAAYRLLTDNSKEFPDFIYNKKSLSIIHALSETVTIPGILKKIFGIKGSINQGIAEINEVIVYSNKEKFIFNQEADAIYAYILFFQKNNKKEAIDFLDNSRLNHQNSPLANFLKVKIAQRSGNNILALEYLNEKPEGKPYANFYYLEFLEGLSKLRMLDTHSIEHFQNYLDRFSGLHYIKEAYQKLAWAHLVFYEDIPRYKYYMSLVESKGSKLIDDDEQAYKESISGVIPHPELLKARLLFDGGYYEKAYALLIKKAHLFENNENYKLEYYYRLGRICQALKNYHEAIKLMAYAINIGKTSGHYFACNSALQIALIFENQGELENSRIYYLKCLDLDPYEYKRSLHQKAKTGLGRLKK